MDKTEIKDIVESLSLTDIVDMYVLLTEAHELINRFELSANARFHTDGGALTKRIDDLFLKLDMPRN